jgi:hypothetical protein
MRITAATDTRIKFCFVLTIFSRLRISVSACGGVTSLVGIEGDEGDDVGSCGDLADFQKDVDWIV